MGYNLFEAALNGVAFSSLGQEDDLVLVDIIEEEAKMDTQTVALGLKSGMLRTVNRRNSLAVKLEFHIRTQDVVRRAHLRDAVADWARNGGILTTNTRPGKFLAVKCDTSVALQSSGKWTESIALTLTAYGVPYWQSDEEAALAVTSSKISDSEYHYTGILAVNGSIDTQVSVMLVNDGQASMTRVKIQCGSTMMELEDMSLESGHALLISYDEDNILSIADAETTGGDDSLFPNRTPASDDDLVAKSATDNQIVISADQPYHGKVSAKGRWM